MRCVSAALFQFKIEPPAVASAHGFPVSGWRGKARCLRSASCRVDKVAVRKVSDFGNGYPTGFVNYDGEPDISLNALASQIRRILNTAWSNDPGDFIQVLEVEQVHNLPDGIGVEVDPQLCRDTQITTGSRIQCEIQLLQSRHRRGRIQLGRVGLFFFGWWRGFIRRRGRGRRWCNGQSLDVFRLSRSIFDQL